MRLFQYIIVQVPTQKGLPINIIQSPIVVSALDEKNLSDLAKANIPINLKSDPTVQVFAVPLIPIKIV